MPEIDKNYLAGLYLDEITLDVMPQEYIDAALEVKLRYDACAPRAGYVCVQDRRVKGGFYYRKAPQGQGVNALPPSKLERALARSQEQSRPRSEMGFLSKAAIGAGLAVGGLALTGAVVNAGRSSEPYQEPVRQKPDPAKTHFNATTIGVAGVAASSVGATVIGLSKKTESQKVEETIKPEESAKTEAPKTPEEVQKKEGADAAGYDIAAIKEMTSSPISSSAIAYENALAIKYSKEGGLAQGREKASLYAPEGDENFVRLSDVQYSAEKKEPTKASRAKTSADLQKTHDKLKEYGLEDSIEFRKARSKARGKEGAELNTASANPYSITRDGVTESVGEMRFTRSPKEIQKAIAEKLKEQATRSQPPEKSAKPPKPEVEPVDPKAPEWLKENIAATVKTVSKPDQEKIVALSQTKTAKQVAQEMGLYVDVDGAKVLDTEKVRAVRSFYNVPSLGEKTTVEAPKAVREQAQGVLANAIRRGAPNADGYVNQASLLNDKVLKGRLADNDPATLIAEGVDEGRIQTKKVGKNTYVRDVSAIPFSDLVAEAEKLKGVTDLKGDRRVKDLNDALEYKERKATSDEERAGAANLRAAIAGIQEVELGQRVKKDKPPVVDKEKKSQRGLGADKPASLEDAEKLGLVPKDTPAPSTSAISDLDAATATANLEAEREKTKKRLSRAETGVPTRDRETYISPKKQFEADVKTLKTQLEEEEVSPDKLNKRVEELRQQKTAQDALKVDTTLSRLEEDYQLEIGAKEDEISRARDKASAKVKRGELAQIISNKNKAVEARTLEVYRSLGIPDLVEDTPKVAPKKESPAPPPTTPPVTPESKATSGANVAATSSTGQKTPVPPNKEEKDPVKILWL